MLRRRSVQWAAALAGLAVVWAAAATWYIATKDEIAVRFFAAQTELRYTYEDRIADLKGRLEREITQNLVERNSFSTRAEALARRQAEIEARQTWLSNLAERVIGREAAPPGDGPPRPSPPLEPRPTQPVEAGTKPAPIAEPLTLRPTSPAGEAKPGERAPDRLTRIEQGLAEAAAQAVRTADLLRRATEERTARIRLALDGTRLDLGRIATSRDIPAGGPLVPLPSGYDSQLFGGVMNETDAGLTELNRLVAASRALPLARPLPLLEQTSGFGYRVDPFTRAPALHTGLDFRADHGNPVRATADGKVTISEYTAGYGNLVEVDHGNGITTRYGHLSSFAVVPGATIEAGQIVGRAGSTGRSTGAHLHYEVRIDGEPVNPARFLEAGRLLGTVTR